MAKANKDKDLMVAAIDFGTTYSGYAFGMTRELTEDPPKVYCPTWHAADGGLISYKTPTTVLLDENRELVAFGFDAEEQYAELADENDHVDHYYFHRFKMMLYEKIRTARLTLNETVKDIRGKELPAIDVFSHAIKFMKNHLVDSLKQKGTSIVEEEIFWVLTVPAIWDDPAKQFMRTAAEMAGLNGSKLTIALEPEAASIWCTHLPVEKLHGSEGKISTFQEGSKYLVLDAGGGTIDITVHEVKAEGKLKELERASGGDWGGTSVDKAFKKMLCDILGGEGAMEGYIHRYTGDYIELLRDFEIKKRKRTDTTEGKITLKIPVTFMDTFSDIRSLTNQSVYKQGIKWEADKLRIDSKTFDGFFKPACKGIIEHVNELLRLPKVRGIEFILMVGGFSESPVLQDAMKKAFPNLKIIVPQEAGLVVLKGAALFGQNPTVIDSRIAQRTYGVKTNMTFDPSKHDESRKFEVEGIFKCEDLFDTHVKIGDTLLLNVAQEEQIYTPLRANQTAIGIPLYKSIKANPMYTDDPSCTYLGTLEVAMPDLTGGKDRKVKVSLIFGGTEIEVKAVVVKSGKISSAKFNFLEEEP
ncbi:heat shock 70 kDa protein 12A-like [Saccostrea cucullata]|uniref:heat shock 70 kDa protein 12A-like n=1 Tax=Saccostrea cuccullata TaxID=36930 RepID=UPI002ED110B8